MMVIMMISFSSFPPFPPCGSTSSPLFSSSPRYQPARLYYSFSWLHAHLFCSCPQTSCNRHRRRPFSCVLVFCSSFFYPFHQMICNRRRRRRRHCHPFSFVSFCIFCRPRHLHHLLCHHHPCIFFSASSCISDLPHPLHRRHRPWICSLHHRHRHRHCHPFSFVSFCIFCRPRHLHHLLCHHHP